MECYINEIPSIYIYILMGEMIWSIYFCAHPVFLLLRSAVILTIAGGLMHILYSIIAIMQFGLEGFKVSFNVRNNLWLNWNTSSSYIVFHLCVIPFQLYKVFSFNFWHYRNIKCQVPHKIIVAIALSKCLKPNIMWHLL